MRRDLLLLFGLLTQLLQEACILLRRPPLNRLLILGRVLFVEFVLCDLQHLLKVFQALLESLGATGDAAPILILCRGLLGM